ncbi:EAL domain-containing protein [Metallumcola ferriviriculae]|uniref:EAL domain-containing protein n=1 Tax=Metallumcola ferriviriculae TaxID=3039180 RepID=A0AAU0UQ95_9FIRM|nr:EAL domain-containing protein [Desulfitibacteraceae bacterium MK1]
MKTIMEEMKSLNHSLEESRQRYKSLFYHHPDMVYSLDNEEEFTTANPACAGKLGYSMQELEQCTIDDLIVKKDRQLISDKIHEAFQGEAQSFEVKAIHKDGSLIDLHITHLPIVINGKAEGVFGIARDITEQKQAERELKSSEERYRQLVELAPVGITTYQQGKVTYVNSMAMSIIGIASPDQIIGRNPLDFVHHDYVKRALHRIADAEIGNNQEKVEGKYVRLDGKPIDVEIATMSFDYNGQRIVQTIFNEITERKRYEADIKKLAYYDTLTGLPNRSLFLQSLSEAIANPKDLKQRFALLFLDLDKFKNVNDSFGHLTGDHLLKDVATRLQTVLRTDDMIARLSGDEFAVLVPHINGAADVFKVTEKILESFRTPFFIKEQELSLDVSIGIAFYPSDGTDVETLLKNADFAMYRAKEGQKSYQVYSPAVHTQFFKRLQLEQTLYKALEKREFVLHYQPQVNINTGKITSMEALIRWNHPEQGLLYPNKFIPLAEETGLIIPIGGWVIDEACRQYKLWQQKGYSDIKISVNLSPNQFRNQDIVTVVKQALDRHNLNGHWLELEITESIIMQNVDNIISILHELKRNGIKVSIDDFGAGYSSLSYLKRLPVDRLKIDQSFVVDIPVDPNAEVITTAIISLAHNLGIGLVAEGVETDAQASFLKNRGCEIMQGYLFSRPLPVSGCDKLFNGGKSFGQFQ